MPAAGAKIFITLSSRLTYTGKTRLSRLEACGHSVGFFAAVRKLFIMILSPVYIPAAQAS
jgi:hypothetical protein